MSFQSFPPHQEMIARADSDGDGEVTAEVGAVPHQGFAIRPKIAEA